MTRERTHPKQSGNKGIIAVLVILLGLAVGVAVIGKEQVLSLFQSGSAIQQQIIGTWEDDDGSTIAFTESEFTAKDGVVAPYDWVPGSIERRSLGNKSFQVGSLVVERGPVKATFGASMNPSGTVLIITMGPQRVSYRKQDAP